MQPNSAIHDVRGQVDDVLSTEILSFWEANGFAGADARDRLGEVVCVLRDDGGAIAGVSSAFAAAVPLIGGRRFWIFRALLAAAVAGRRPELERATFAALNAAFDGAPGAPIGLVLLLGEADRRARPEADWPDPRTIYAGYAADGRQVRVAYFDDACIVPGEPRDGGGRPLDPRHRIELFAEQDAVSEQDVIDLWIREGAMPLEEAHRRVSELHLVAIGDRGEPAGVTTRYLQRNAQLQTAMWHYRALAATEHRMSALTTWLAVTGRDDLERRFVGGEDRRAPGVIYEVENEFLKSYFPKAHWMPTDFLYIGDSPIGAHVRVHWFAGALAPEPAAQGST